jgi:D-lactate dehydrogenase (cytochrome)
MDASDQFFVDCRKVGIRVSTAGLEDYLHDESRLQGHAAGLIRASNQSDVIECLRLANKWRVPLTVVSGKTSLTGAAVPFGGAVLDVRGLNHVDPEHPSVVGPGIVLKHYRDVVRGAGYFYPPDPSSEDSCTLGGNVACNASGPLSYLYGPTREYIMGLKVALPTGNVLKIHRGQVVSSGGTIRIPAGLAIPRGQADTVIPVPKTGVPEWTRVKSAAGLFSQEPVDLVDLFIGSEGILGVILEIETRLLPQRRNPFVALSLYVPSRDATVELVTLLNLLKQVYHDKKSDVLSELLESLARISKFDKSPPPEQFKSIVPSCMEWLGSSLAPLMPADRSGKLRVSYGCLYVEQEYSDAEDSLVRLSQWAALVELINKGLWPESPGIQVDVALEEAQARRMKKDRQMVPSKLNELIRPGMVKVGTDFSVPIEKLGSLLAMYDESLPSGKSYVFGHIGNAHLHANIIARSDHELKEYRSLTQTFAKNVCSMGGSVSGEHGIGKLKREALEIMLGKQAVDQIREIKRLLDPKFILNPGNMIAEDPGNCLSTEVAACKS